jgi:hypothetical protein
MRKLDRDINAARAAKALVPASPAPASFMIEAVCLGGAECGPPPERITWYRGQSTPEGIPFLGSLRGAAGGFRARLGATGA